MDHLGLAPADILLPGSDTEYDAWAVIACDQFTQDRPYWDRVNEQVGERPSTLRMVLPEIDLADGEKRIPGIQAAMREYRKSVLTRAVRGMVYVRRSRNGVTRRGLVAAIDLEAYSFLPDAKSLIRATEGTILERLPPRAAIRRGAELESPHILLLIDDPGKTVVEPLEETVSEQEPLYDFDLMLDGGHITGWAVEDTERLGRIADGLTALLSADLQAEKYGKEAGENPLLFAVGDGNHSLATARACWLEVKRDLSPSQQQGHPARYALVEITNLQEEQLLFHPIHRVLFGVEPKAALEDFAGWLNQTAGAEGEQSIAFLHAGGEGEICTPRAPHTLQAGTVQMWLDAYLERHPQAEVDYIHGDAEARALARREGALALLLPPPPKDDLFGSIVRHGPLPRKTFSMGEALDKRYYLECRALGGGEEE